MSERACKPNSVTRSPGLAIIPLVPRSPSGSSSRPGDGPREAGWAGPPPSPFSALLRMGFTVPPPLPEGRCALTAPFHPCRPEAIAAERRSLLCGTFLRVAATGHYPACRPYGVRTFLPDRSGRSHSPLGRANSNRSVQGFRFASSSNHRTHSSTSTGDSGVGAVAGRDSLPKRAQNSAGDRVFAPASRVRRASARSAVTTVASSGRFERATSRRIASSALTAPANLTERAPSASGRPAPSKNRTTRARVRRSRSANSRASAAWSSSDAAPPRSVPIRLLPSRRYATGRGSGSGGLRTAPGMLEAEKQDAQCTLHARQMGREDDEQPRQEKGRDPGHEKDESRENHGDDV